ncbi:pentapeptide repeat-containing protein [Streptomyces pseudovenezuelae]|nr:pentapeptide repeat-containing protein [Streptomyces pseudovenezuelae]
MSAAPEGSPAAPNLDVSALTKANDSIRIAAKWLIGSSAAVGAALLAGSQLSNIGKLDWGWRLWVAIGGATVGLIAVIWAIWLATLLLMPVTVTIDRLQEQWKKPTKELKAAVEFLKREPRQLGEWKSPKGLKKAEKEAKQELQDAQERGDEKAKEVSIRTLTKLRSYRRSIQQVAQHKALEARFHDSLRWLVLATGMAALGIVSFAWASNPPAPKTPSADLENAKLVGVDLRDAELNGANLDHTDLTNALLTGADLTDASLTDVTWKNTTCPDGVNSNKAGNTCAGHLGPKS